MSEKNRRKQDHFSRSAQSAGYPARSVYKLEEIDKKFHLLQRGMRVLDLGAAPGSWTLYCARKVGKRGSVVAVDTSLFSLDLPSESGTVTYEQGDFTAELTKQSIDTRAPFDVVLSDAAPATTGNRLVDTSRSERLVESVIENLDRWLRPGGSLAVKLFQGGAERRLREDLRGRFSKAQVFRPRAVRSESFETYLIGFGYSVSNTAE